MIKQMYVKTEDVSYFIENVGLDNILHILPIEYQTSSDGIITYSGKKSESTSTSIVTKFMLVYHD